MFLNCGVGEDSWESHGLQEVPTSPSSSKSNLNINWKDWCWSWNSNTLATWCKELTHLKRPWCWKWLKVGGERDGREWDGWMASPTQWTWVWRGSRSWWWTGKPCILQSMGSQRVRHDCDWTITTQHGSPFIVLCLWHLNFTRMHKLSHLIISATCEEIKLASNATHFSDIETEIQREVNYEGDNTYPFELIFRTHVSWIFAQCYSH